jgi:hypothetical protein
MKIKKSILSIILVMTLIITSLIPSIVFADVPGSSASIVRLQQLGIVDGSITDTKSPLTRAQLANAIAVAKDLTDEAATLSGSTIFPDVDSNSELSGYVNALLSRGLMYGRPDGYFHPEGGVSYAEACTILVKLLGYTDSDVTGMWPNNYISKATDLKLNDNIKLKKNDIITVGTAAIMLDRLLDTKVKKTTAAEVEKTFSEYVSLYTDIVVYDNALTNRSLSSNSVLTDKGTFYLSDSNIKLQVGNTYRVALDETYIDKVYGSIKEADNITVDSFMDNKVYYKLNNTDKNMILPSGITYYYHGTKQDYAKLSEILKTNSTVVLIYNNNNKTGYEYAVIIDPIFSKPEVALNFKVTSDKLGSISFDDSTKIIKNGEIISKSDIEEMDVVYSVTDVNGNNRAIFVYNDRAEGNIKGFSPNGPVPTSVTIDSKSYNFSKDMDLSPVSQFRSGDKVSALLGYDSKVVALKKITYMTRNEVEVKILENIKTSDDLLDNQVLTDIGKYYLLDSISNLEVGAKYIVYLDDNTIVKIKKKENTTENYGVRHIAANTITYNTKDGVGTFVLPKISTYYYKGNKIDYATAFENIKIGSSIILTKINGNYDYGLIIDPIYSEPIIKTENNRAEIEDKYDDGAMFAYRNGHYYESSDMIFNKDVVYVVSDIWNTTKYMYITNQRITGKVKNIAPNKINPKTIQIDSVSYKLSKYFDVTKLSTVDIGLDSIITLDIEGEVIDISAY